jgi:hypothetical protein
MCLHSDTPKAACDARVGFENGTYSDHKMAFRYCCWDQLCGIRLLPEMPPAKVNILPASQY